MIKDISLNKKWHNFVWSSMLFFVLLGIGLFLTGTNKEVFFIINGVSDYTGGGFWQYITIFGDGYITAVLLLLFINRKPKIAWSFVIATIIYMVILHSLKNGLDINRPPGVLDLNQFNLFGPEYSHNSFPSGHTTTIFTLTTVISLCQKSLKKAFLLLIIALFVGISRIAIGMHWPLDICAGAVLGIVSGYAGVYISEFTTWGYSKIAKKVFHIILIAGCIYMIIFYSTGYDKTFLLTRIIGVFCIFYWIVDFLKSKNIYFQK